MSGFGLIVPNIVLTLVGGFTQKKNEHPASRPVHFN
jgi:hypothetical protein